MTIALLIVIVLLLLFISHQISEFGKALADTIDGELQRRKNVRENTRRYAEEALRLAYRDYTDPQFKEIDYNLGDGRGYRKAERMCNAKTWAEVEEIASGDPESFKEELKQNKWGMSADKRP
jgi:hypothetical protein